jgi:serine/threonine protein kinase
MTRNLNGEPKMMSLETWREFVNEKIRLMKEDADNTEILINFLNTYNLVTINDFEILSICGKGGFATVYKAQHRETSEFYALKAVKKQEVIHKNQFESVRREKEILHSCNSPFLVDLKCAFQTTEYLFFVMPYIEGGDLSVFLRKRGTFWENEVKFFTAQIILALDFLHGKGIIYQDLKPGNVLLGTDGYIKLTDFGAAKLKHQTKNYRTFVGTIDYIAPEVLNKEPYSKSIDWWALGILIYQLLYRTLPFTDKNPKNLVRKIKEDEVIFPEEESSVNVISEKCKNFIRECLTKDPTKRLGYESHQSLVQHPWFEDFEFDKLLSREILAPLIPEMEIEEEISQDDEDQEVEIDLDNGSMLEDEILSEIKRFDPMFKGFYLDQMNPAALTETSIPEILLKKPARDQDETLEAADESPNNLDRSRIPSCNDSNADNQSLSFSRNVSISRREKFSALKIDGISHTDPNGDDVSVSDCPGSRLVSPPALSITNMSISNKNGEGHGRSYQFDFFSPSILLGRERSMNQTGMSTQPTMMGPTETKDNDSDHGSDIVQNLVGLKGVMLDDWKSISSMGSNKSITITPEGISSGDTILPDVALLEKLEPKSPLGKDGMKSDLKSQKLLKKMIKDQVKRKKLFSENNIGLELVAEQD